MEQFCLLMVAVFFKDCHNGLCNMLVVCLLAKDAGSLQTFPNSLIVASLVVGGSMV